MCQKLKLCGTNDFISAQLRANVPFLFVHVWFYAWLQCSENFDVLRWPHMTYWLTSYMNGWHLQSMHASTLSILKYLWTKDETWYGILHWSWSELELAITDLAYDRRRLFCMVRRVPCLNELSISCLIGLVLSENFAGKSDVCFGLWWHIPILFQSQHLGRARGLGYIEVVASHGWKEKLLPLQFDCKVSALIPLDDQMDLEALADAESQVCFLAIRWEWLCWCSSCTCWKWT
jgi:hypothetical protein